MGQADLDRARSWTTTFVRAWRASDGEAAAKLFSENRVFPILNIGKGYATSRIPKALDRCQTPLETCKTFAWEAHPFKADADGTGPAWKADVGRGWIHSVGVESLYPTLGWNVE